MTGAVTWLVVPADGPAPAGPDAVAPDAVVYDLTAGPGDPRQRRDSLGALLAGASAAAAGVWVQVAAGDSVEDDLQAVLRHRVGGLWVRGATIPQQLADIAAVLGRRPVTLMPVIDSAVGLLNSGALVAVDRVAGFVMDDEAVAADLGMDPTPDEHELASVRGHLVVVSTAFGRAAPVGGPPPARASSDQVRASTDRLRRLGYGGRAVRDPAQLAVVAEVFGGRGNGPALA